MIFFPKNPWLLFTIHSFLSAVGRKSRAHAYGTWKSKIWKSTVVNSQLSKVLRLSSTWILWIPSQGIWLFWGEHRNRTSHRKPGDEKEKKMWRYQVPIREQELRPNSQRNCTFMNSAAVLEMVFFCPVTPSSPPVPFAQVKKICTVCTHSSWIINFVNRSFFLSSYRESTAMVRIRHLFGWWYLSPDKIINMGKYLLMFSLPGKYCLQIYLNAYDLHCSCLFNKKVTKVRHIWKEAFELYKNQPFLLKQSTSNY
jgi:hypothetical protein